MSREDLRIEAMKKLAAASRRLANELLESIGESSDVGYFRAMAMDAVIDLVAREWERRESDAEMDVETMLMRPLRLVQTASVNPEVVSAALDLAEKTWRPVETKDHYKEVVATSLHKAYWALYMVGEHVDGISDERCHDAVQQFARFLAQYPRDQELSVEMAANWYSASMHRMTSMLAAELRGRGSRTSRILTDDDFQECIDVTIDGFEGIEENAEKLLEFGESIADRMREHPVDR